MTFASALALVFWVSFLVAGGCAYPTYRLLLALRSRQTVSEFAPEGHQAKQGTPTMGGLIVVVGLLASAVAMMAFLRFGDPGSRVPARPLISAFVLVLLFGVIGFIDDFLVPRLIPGKRGLGWKQKIVLELIFAIVALLCSYESVSIGGWIGTVFLILFFSNAYNFSDGLDALSGTLLLGLALGLAGIAYLGGLGFTMVAWPVALIGAILPFLFLNAPPAKVFMGDVGSLGIGALLGFLVSQCVGQATSATWLESGSEIRLQATTQAPGLVAAALAIWSLVMVIELVPVPIQIASVKLFKRRVFPYTPIHHAFEKAGWKETRVVALFALTQVLLSVMACTLLIWGGVERLGR